MARFAALKLFVRKFQPTRRPKPVAAEALFDRSQMVAEAIYQRDRMGHPTTLRDLHKIVELAQSEALKAVAELEQAGLAVVHHNTYDAFESVITLTSEMRLRCETDSKRNAA